ncbi:ABC transporter permease [Intestinibacillus sp. Marseille-P6563]|uniref:ABC transporter permease n=1 Tax=Intestinibacillus sp. Marseille-P6563 TaxID=2364792 RepID=UPI000F046F43|nr:ABC transporter permease [Intestinibacillus sp. Marseille-P6563]
MMRSIRAEIMKLRRSCIWLAMLFLPLLSAGFGTANYLGNLSILQDQWYSLWTQHALFYCTLFAPALTGVYCAYVCRLEHLNRNWNLVMTMPVSRAQIWMSKIIVVSMLTGLTQLFIGILFVLSGKVAGLTAPIPLALVFWLVRGWCSLIVQTAVLLCVALVIRSFAVPVACGIGGGFLGIAVLVKGFGVYFPFSLLPLSMCSHNPTEPMQCSAGLFVCMSLFYFLLACACGISWMRRRDVQTA